MSRCKSLFHSVLHRLSSNWWRWSLCTIFGWWSVRILPHHLSPFVLLNLSIVAYQDKRKCCYISFVTILIFSLAVWMDQVLFRKHMETLVLHTLKTLKWRKLRCEEIYCFSLSLTHTHRSTHVFYSLAYQLFGCGAFVNRCNISFVLKK